ncbi:MAG: PGPGW domain-containing protein [Actinobacteria bacterium]|nr:PGPGW domain-containing protein [Actinomycetota bacterium]
MGRRGRPGDPPTHRSRPGAVRRWLRTNRLTRRPYLIVVTSLGVATIGVGIVLLALPGPGWLVIFLGLGILASEYRWAEQLSSRLRAVARFWNRWVSRQSVPVRILLGSGVLLLLVGVAVGYLLWRGVPFGG